MTDPAKDPRFIAAVDQIRAQENEVFKLIQAVTADPPYNEEVDRHTAILIDTFYMGVAEFLSEWMVNYIKFESDDPENPGVMPKLISLSESPSPDTEMILHPWLLMFVHGWQAGYHTAKDEHDEEEEPVQN